MILKNKHIENTKFDFKRVRCVFNRKVCSEKAKIEIEMCMMF